MATRTVADLTFDDRGARSTTVSSATITLGYDANNRRNSTAATDNSWWSYPANSASTLSYTANALNQYSAVREVWPGPNAFCA